jgi:hypothetical protein
MRQRGGKPRTNSPLLYIEEDEIAKILRYYGVFVTDYDGYEKSREYLTKTQYDIKYNEYFGPNAQVPSNYTCKQITEHGIPYIHYNLQNSSY